MSDYHRILVTGGAGFVGSHLVDRLVAMGRQVTVLDDLSSGVEANINKAARFVKGDIRNHALIADLIADNDACFHLAAIASVAQCEESWENSHSVNLASFVGLLECSAKRADGVIPVVYTSSAAVYGNKNVFPLNEDQTPRPISVYGADKAGCELHARAAGATRGVPTFGLRPFNIYGSRQQASSPYSGVITLFADRLKRGEKITVFGDGNQTRDFIFVGDIVDHFIAALDKASSDAPICNAATGHEVSIIDIAQQLADIIGRKADIIFAPARVADLYRSVADTARAQSLLGLVAATPIEQGLSFVRGN